MILPVEEYSLVRDLLERATQSAQADVRDRAEAALIRAGLIQAPSGTTGMLPAIPPLRRKALAEAYTSPVPLSDLINDDRDGL